MSRVSIDTWLTWLTCLYMASPTWLTCDIRQLAHVEQNPGHNECRTGDWSPILSKQTECPVPKVWRQLSAQSHPVPDISRGLSAQSQSPSGDSVPSPASPERCARTPALAVRAGERYQENTVQLLKHLNRANTQGGEQTKNKHSGSEQTVGWWCW